MTNTPDQLKQELAEKIRPFINNESNESNTDPQNEEVEKVENEEDNEEKVEDIEEVENEENNEEVEEEVEEFEGKEESLITDKDPALSGYVKEFKELLTSIKDPELQKKVIEAGKVTRAREDRISSELGNIKKQYESVLPFKNLIESNPQEAILQIAKMANINLSNFNKSTAENNDNNESDYYEYNPEARLLKEKIDKIQHELENQRLEKSRNEQEEIFREIDSFSKNKEKYPYFDDLEESMARLLFAENHIKGMPKSSQERIDRLDKAYNQAILLDDNLRQKRDNELLIKTENERKARIEKAKLAKKVNVKSVNNPVEPANLEESLRLALKKQGFNFE